MTLKSDIASPNRQPTIAIVGHCSPDTGMLKSAFGALASGFEFVRVNDAASLARHRHPAAIWLVNRVLDGDFGSDDGLSIIDRVTKDAEPPVAILISNYDDAQAEAVRRGALPGFGKKALYAEASKAAFRRAMERVATALPKEP
jgi:hypothetical protein